MRLATIKIGTKELAGIQTSKGIVTIKEINKQRNKFWEEELFDILQAEQLDEIQNWYKKNGKECLEAMATTTFKEVRYAPLLRHPHKIWGIGLNYVDHAGDLSEKVPTVAPASFPKWENTIIGYGDTVKVPVQSQKTTGEAELAIIYKKKCKNVAEKDWLSVVAGFTTVIDMTAEDILRINPRYLTQAKNFDTFLSIGSVLVTPDEIEDVLKLKVSTVINGAIHGENIVANMTFQPAFLTSFHTKVATTFAGDMICTGTPRAVHITDGDVIECRITGFLPLKNPVIELAHVE